MGLTDVIRRLGSEYTVYPLESEAPADGDGHADIVMGTPHQVRARISSAGSGEYQRDDLGQVETFSYHMTVLPEADIETDDRVIFEGNPYRVSKREDATYHNFRRFTLVEDDRVADPGSGETESDGTPVSGSGSDGFEWDEQVS